MCLSNSLRLFATALLAALFGSTADAQYYWDENGSAPGFGTAASTWDTAGSTFWNNDPFGGSVGTPNTLGTSITTATTDTLNFGTATDGLGAGTINVTATVNAGDINFGFASGAIVLSGGTINLAATSTITVDNATNTINSILSGAGIRLTKAGTGTLVLSGANTYTGATAINNGTLALGVANNRLPTGTTVTLGDGTANTSGILKLDSRSQQLAGLLTAGSGTGNRVVNGNAAAATLTLNFASGTNTFGGILGGPGTNENNFALTKAGAGTLTLTGANTYTGNTFVSAGTLNVTGTYTPGVTTGSVFLANGGSLTFNMGSGTANFYGDGFTNSMQVGEGATTGTLTLQSGTLNVITRTSGSAGSVRLGLSNAAANGTIVVNGGTLNVPGRILFAANSTSTAQGTLTINGGTVNMGTVGSGNYSDPGSGLLWFGAGTSRVNLNGGTLALYSLFAPTAGSNVTVNLNGGTLKAVNSNTTFTNVTAGTFTMRVQAGGAIVDSNTFNITISRALVEDTGSTGGGLTKNGAGRLTLTATGTYTGATAINGGTLALGSGGNLGVTAVTVNSPGALGVVQTASATSNAITGSIALNAGAAFTMADTFASTLNVTGASTLAPASGTPTTLTFDIVGVATDRLAITGAATVGAGGAKINIAPSTTAITAGDFTVISAASGLNTNFSLTTSILPNAGGLYTLSLANSTEIEEIVTVAADANALYWKGAATAWNTAGNWTTDQGGTSISGSAPSSTTNVAFSAATPANLTANTLTAPLTVNSVNFLPGAAIVTVGTTGNTTNPLTINGGGITNGSANAMTINNPIALGAAQTWTNSGTGTLTIGGGINNGANLLTIDGTGNTTISGIIGTAVSRTGGLTKNGTGTLSLSGVNAYTGATNINAGNLIISGTGVIANTATNTITIGNGGTLTMARNDTWGASGGGGNPVIPIVISAGGTMTTGGSWFNTLGPLTLNGGTLTTTGGVFPQFPSWALRGTVTVGGSVASTISAGSGTNPMINLGANSVTGTTFDVADATGDSSSDLNVSAVLQNGSNASNVVQASSLTKSGLGTMTLTGNNTYTGGTTISAGTLVVGSTGALPASRAVTLSGGTLSTTVGVSPNALGTLTLNGPSFIDLAASAHTLTFTTPIGTSGTVFITGSTATPGISSTLGQIIFTGYGNDTTAANANTAFLTKVQFSGYNLGDATFIANGSNVELVPVPEPAAILGLAAAGMGLAGWVRRRKYNSHQAPLGA